MDTLNRVAQQISPEVEWQKGFESLEFTTKDSDLFSNLMGKILLDFPNTIDNDLTANLINVKVADDEVQIILSGDFTSDTFKIIIELRD